MGKVCAAPPTDGSRLWIQWTLSDRGRVRIVSFAGEIDGTNADYLVSTLQPALQSGTERLIFDLAGVAVLDDAGAAALGAIYDHAAAQHVRLDVVCGPAPLRVAMLIPGRPRVGLHTTVSEALGAQCV